MKKFLSVALSVVAICISVCSIAISVRTLEAVKNLEGTGNAGEASAIDIDEVVDNVVSELENSEETDFTDEQMEAINQAIVDFLASKEVASSEEDGENQDENSSEDSEETTEEEEPDYSFTLTDEERTERLAKQQEIQEAREYLYTQPHTIENSEKINQLDEMMIASNTIDFSDKIITYLGDSLTEGIGSSTDSEGNYRSYVYYMNNIFHFEKAINNGVAGWMYSNYHDGEYSIVANLENKIYIDSDIMIFFYGINDYISEYEDKRFGTYSSTTSSTAGFCGDFEVLCTYLTNYFDDRDIFFVLSYPISRSAGGTYQVESESHELSDYMDAIKTISTRHGFNVIDLYSTGLIDGTNVDMQKAYLSDLIHPNDKGYELIGEHIAAEISYVLGKEQ